MTAAAPWTASRGGGPGLPRRADAVVVGGGVVGLAVAFNLARLGLAEVVVIERDRVGSGGSGRSGGLVRLHYTTLEEARLALAALPWFEEWGERVGGYGGFVRTGFLQLVSPRDQGVLAENTAALRGAGVATWLVGPEEIRELEPGLRVGPEEVGAYEPRSGYADPAATVTGLATAARARGARVVEGVAVDGLVWHRDRVQGVATSGGQVAAPVVVVANGAWAARLLAPLGVEVGLTPVRAQVAYLARPAALGRSVGGHPAVIDRANGCYLRPDGRDRTLVGLSAFHEVLADVEGWDRGLDKAFTATVVRQVARRVPGADRSPVLGGHSGPLDVTRDGRMVLGAVPGVGGLYLAVGMSGGGFKQAPAIGACLAELILGGRSETAPIDAFGVARFSEAPPPPARDYSLPREAVGDEARARLGPRGLIH
ncbi:MAG TPA: FAD-binding oxidoreductase [Acidimicrobiales bacterium]|nr:FAD-binding oxidoreductase [Acidimicrobiales bacterium]